MTTPTPEDFIRVTKLPSGLTIVTEQMDRVETISLGAYVASGTRNEEASQNGVSHFLEHMAFKGTERRNAAEIAEAIEDVGGHINAYTAREQTAYYVKLLKEDLELGADIIGDILTHSTFAADEVERERGVILQEIGQANDTPDDIIFDHFQEAAFPNQPMGRPVLGSEKIIRGMKGKQIKNYMARHYAAGNVVVAATGNLEHDRVVDLVARHFADLPSEMPKEPVAGVYHGGEFRETRDLDQVHIVLGFPAVSYTDPDYYPAMLLSTLLGGGMSSRLFQEIREKRGLVYSIYSFAAPYVETGLFGIYAGTGESEAGELIPVTLEELHRVQLDANDIELKRARAQVKAGLLMSMESTGSRCEQLSRQIQIFGRIIPTAETIAHIDAVTIDDIKRAAGRIFRGVPTLAAMGPASARAESGQHRNPARRVSLDLLAGLLDAAKNAGADRADCILAVRTSLSVERRLGSTETLERSESRDLGLRVFTGAKSAIVSATSVDPARFASLAERALAMARVVPDDPYADLCEDAAPPADNAHLDLLDHSEPSTEALIARAEKAEKAALAVPGITNSEGGSAGFSRTEMYLATSAGFAGQTARSYHSVSASVIAGEGTGMQRDYEYHGAMHLADLDDPAAIGHSAGERAVARLNPKRPKTGKMPVVYDPRISGGLVGHLSGAINGASIARGTSFLKDKMGQRLFAPGVFIHDDPHRVRGTRSAMFDAEGVPTKPRALIEDGVLTTWLLDSRSARQLGVRTTGHASRGTGGPPGPSASNLYLAAGTATPAELMADIELGLYVTELIGTGLNGMTGDYSRGAAGFMIRNGALAEPVAEITIAGNLLEMFAALTPANDLVFRRGTDAPSVRVDGMIVAGD